MAICGSLHSQRIPAVIAAGCALCATGLCLVGDMVPKATEGIIAAMAAKHHSHGICTAPAAASADKGRTGEGGKNTAQPQGGNLLLRQPGEFSFEFRKG